MLLRTGIYIFTLSSFFFLFLFFLSSSNNESRTFRVGSFEREGGRERGREERNKHVKNLNVKIGRFTFFPNLARFPPTFVLFSPLFDWSRSGRGSFRGGRKIHTMEGLHHVYPLVSRGPGRLLAVTQPVRYVGSHFLRRVVSFRYVKLSRVSPLHRIAHRPLDSSLSNGKIRSIDRSEGYDISSFP